MDKLHSLALILIMAALTAALRFLPFVMFSKGTPKTIVYLGNLLPNAIMAMLVVYCLKNVSFTAGSHGIPEALAVFWWQCCTNGSTICCFRSWEEQRRTCCLCRRYFKWTAEFGRYYNVI